MDAAYHDRDFDIVRALDSSLKRIRESIGSDPACREAAIGRSLPADRALALSRGEN